MEKPTPGEVFLKTGRQIANVLGGARDKTLMATPCAEVKSPPAQALRQPVTTGAGPRVYPGLLRDTGTKITHTYYRTDARRPARVVSPGGPATPARPGDIEASLS
jgi:hypothetical protein